MKVNSVYQHKHMKSTSCIVLNLTAKGCKTRVTETPAKGRPFTTIQYYNTIDFDSAKGFWELRTPIINAENIARLRKEVNNIKKATDAGSIDFELMAKLHGSPIYKCRYNEVGYIYCDTMIVKDGRTAITEQNMQYYPAKVRYYFTKS